MKTPKLEEIISRLQTARDELEKEIERLLEGKQKQFHYTLRRGKVIFDRNVRKLHRRQRTGSLAYILRAPIGALLSAPVIYGMVVPLFLLDITISFYQAVCFRIYGIPRVKRNDYIVIDRHRLPYLNWVQKFNCIYCGYGNGLMAYAQEIIARTEQFWCPIKHAIRAKGVHHREIKFFDYGDAERWAEEVCEVRCDWDNQDKHPQA
tara:strand:- start:137145 stop:137762 length:618 start_codon:yes stop_codon:yes gene_type:complete